VHVSTYPVNSYSGSIYRMGYYGGAGARLMRRSVRCRDDRADAEGWRTQPDRVQLEGRLQPRDSRRLAERRLPRKAVDAARAHRSSTSIWR
jgi:hypothetical protein